MKRHSGIGLLVAELLALFSVLAYEYKLNFPRSNSATITYEVVRFDDTDKTPYFIDEKKVKISYEAYDPDIVKSISVNLDGARIYNEPDANAYSAGGVFHRDVKLGHHSLELIVTDQKGEITKKKKDLTIN